MSWFEEARELLVHGTSALAGVSASPMGKNFPYIALTIAMIGSTIQQNGPCDDNRRLADLERVLREHFVTIGEEPAECDKCKRKHPRGPEWEEICGKLDAMRHAAR